LLHIADAAQTVFGRMLVQIDNTTGGLRETGNDIEQCTFAAAAWSDDANEFPGCGVQVYLMQDRKTLSVLHEILAHVLHADFGRARYRDCSAAGRLHPQFLHVLPLKRHGEATRGPQAWLAASFGATYVSYSASR
jgi:hypothetical protein